MQADGFVGQLVLALARQTAAFRGRPASAGTFGRDLLNALGRRAPAFTDQNSDAARPLETVNLSSKDLAYADLTEADLAGADLAGAHLTEADLTGANLRRASLRGADLTDARWNNETIWPDAEYADQMAYTSDIEPGGGYRVRSWGAASPALQEH
jgi:uncharacterized protein YjbI with pentapeptide repeats